MIIAVINAKTIQEALAHARLAKARGADGVELRIDALDDYEEIHAISEIFNEFKTVVTNRRKEEGGLKAQEEIKRIEALEKAVLLKPWAIDIEMATEKKLRQRLEKTARENDVKIIVSHHDFRKTPSKNTLKKIAETALAEGDFAKIACSASTREDAENLLCLVEKHPGKVTAFALGEKFSWTRLESLRIGAPFGYAFLQEENAPGQLSIEEMIRQLK